MITPYGVRHGLDIRHLLPKMTTTKGGIVYSRPGDPGYEEMLRKVRHGDALVRALDRLCTCRKGCSHCGWGDWWDEDCIVHGDDQ